MVIGVCVRDVIYECVTIINMELQLILVISEGSKWVLVRASWLV